VKSRFDLGAFLGRRAQLRWIFGSLAFGDPTFLSYLETPGLPGAFDIDEKDDGWHIDDIQINGLLTNQLNLVVDGGDDIVNTPNVECGANLTSETLAVGDDVQVIAVGGACGTAATAVVTAGGNGVVDSVASTPCGVGGAPAFCTVATSRINSRTNATFSTPYPGSPFVVDGGLSTLDKCESGSIQYEFTRCNTTTIGAACDAPANGTILQGFSSDGQITTFPTVDTRYRLRVRCSSQAGIPGCGAGATATTDARVIVNSPNVYCGPIDAMSVTCVDTAGDTGTCSVSPFAACTVGGALCPGVGAFCITPCDSNDPLQFSFTRPLQAGMSGFNLYRGTEASLDSADIPTINALTCMVPTGGFGAGGAAGDLLTQNESPVTSPSSKAVDIFVVACRQVAPGGVGAPADVQHPSVTGTGINNPAERRWVTPECP
jgi:hypothetical protein